MTRQDEMAGSGGTFTVNDTDLVEKKFYGTEFPEDTVIAELYLNGGSTNIIADFVSTPATGNKANSRLRCKSSDYFSGIKLASGSATLWLTDNN